MILPSLYNTKAGAITVPRDRTGIAGTETQSNWAKVTHRSRSQAGAWRLQARLTCSSSSSPHDLSTHPNLMPLPFPNLSPRSLEQVSSKSPGASRMHLVGHHSQRQGLRSAALAGLTAGKARPTAAHLVCRRNPWAYPVQGVSAADMLTAACHLMGWGQGSHSGEGHSKEVLGCGTTSISCLQTRGGWRGVREGQRSLLAAHIRASHHQPLPKRRWVEEWATGALDLHQ